MKDKWIECECFVIDRNLNEMNIKQEGTPVRFSFLASQIASYRESGEDDGEGECLIYFKSGDNIIINMSYNTIKSMLSE